MSEAENAKQEAFQEALRRRRAEKDAVDAIRRVKFISFSSYELNKNTLELSDATLNEFCFFLSLSIILSGYSIYKFIL